MKKWKAWLGGVAFVGVIVAMLAIALYEVSQHPEPEDRTQRGRAP